MVKNWDKFQHYRDRCPPWIKLATDTFQNYEFSLLSDASKLLAVCIWTLASRSKDGSFPNDLEYIKNQCALGELITHTTLNELITQGFVIDASEVLADCKQSARPEGEAETEGEQRERESALAISEPGEWIKKIRAIGGWRDRDSIGAEHSFVEQVAEKGVDPAKLFEAVCRIYVATDSGKFAPRLSEVIRRWQEPLEFWGRDGASGERVSAAETKQQGAKSAVSRAWAKHRAIGAVDGGDAAVLPERPAY